MSRRKIVSMPGDGIGKTVLPLAIKVLDAVGFEAEYIHADIGWEMWCKEANPLPQRTIDLLREHKIGLFGAITSKPKSAAEKELAPELQGKGLSYASPIVGMRQKFNLHKCVRPCRTFKGNPLNFVRRGPGGSIEEPVVDVVIFRQNTECLYSGVEWTNAPDQVWDALNTHPKFKTFAKMPRNEVAISCRIFSLEACTKIVKAAFEHARQFGYKSVTLCEKPNVIRETSGMMYEVARKIQKEYPEIPLWEVNIDAMMMWLTKNPEDYGVIVCGNVFGDIASDGFAGLVGGLGFACSANVGEDVAVFEPTHGSAPKYQMLKPSIVNPIATVLSGCMMLDHLGEKDKATRIRNAISAVIEEGKVRTYDMLKLRGGPDAIAKGAASSDQMAEAIIKKL